MTSATVWLAVSASARRSARELLELSLWGGPHSSANHDTSACRAPNRGPPASLADVTRSSARISTALVAVALGALALPAVAFAHVANIEYRFPLPVWLYGLAGAIVVVASAPAAAWALRSKPRVGSRNLYPALARFFPGAFLRALTVALLALAIVGGFFAPTLGVENPSVLLFWVDFWVGLGIVSALVGNVSDFVNPLANLGRALDGFLARRGTPQRHYPEALGIWPAVILLLALSWAELVWRDGRDPQNLAAVILGYCILQLLGVARYGAEIWLARGELFTVFARTLSQLAPFELYARAATEPCRARRCGSEAERIGCPSCFADAGRTERGIRLRPFGAGIYREPGLGAGGSAFVIALLATVVFDGLRSTTHYVSLEAELVSLLPRLDDLRQTRLTFMMILIVGAFAALYLLAAALVSLREEGSPLEVARRYAPTLIPIAAVYFIAHYALYLFYTGQLTPRVVLDPSGSGWIREYRPWSGVPGSAVWGFQVIAIVWGHIVAVIVAHRVAKPWHRDARAALAAQLPLLALMALYTFAGLWVLGQALSRS